jgi:hypothetical protein
VGGPLSGLSQFFFLSSPQARKSHTSQRRVHSDEKMRGDLMSVGGQVRKDVWGVGRGLYVPSCPSTFLARPFLPRREKQEAPMEGAMGSSTGNLRWGSGTTGNLDAPFLRALSWGA